jgi:hypothetical protein
MVLDLPRRDEEEKKGVTILVQALLELELRLNVIHITLNEAMQKHETKNQRIEHLPGNTLTLSKLTLLQSSSVQSGKSS